LRDPNVCHVALSEFRPNRLLVRDDSQTINLRSWRMSSMVKMR
jgi:hypothetical protein